MHVLIEQVDASVEPEEVVELRHEVAGDGPSSLLSAESSRRQLGASAGALTTGDGCWASILRRGPLRETVGERVLTTWREACMCVYLCR